jgi:hypothetical protein
LKGVERKSGLKSGAAAALDSIRIVVFEVVFFPPPGLNLTVSPPADLIKIAQLRPE